MNDKVKIEVKTDGPLADLWYKDENGKWKLYGGVMKKALQILAQEPEILKSFLKEKL